MSDTHTVSLESRVLVIEDDPSAGKVTGMLLKMRGYHVVHARDGASGLRLAESDCPGCILMDLGLPDMSGFELLARLRALPALKTCRIIAFTGRTEDEVASGPGSSAFDAVLIKPPEVAELNRHFPSRNGG